MGTLLFVFVLFVVLVGVGWLLGKIISKWIFGKDEDENPYTTKR